MIKGFRVITDVMFTQEDNFLIKTQRRDIISSESESSDNQEN